jgi:hypothetical protein
VIRSWASLLIGLGIPVVAILGGVLGFGHSAVQLLGFPIVFFWMFCCFPLTTLCLWVSWRYFDRRHYPTEGTQ